MTQRVGRVIALLLHDRGTRRGEWSAARPGRTLPPGKTQYPLYRRLDGHQGQSGRAANLVPTGIRSRTVQPVVSRYADRATRPTIKESILENFTFSQGDVGTTYITEDVVNTNFSHFVSTIFVSSLMIVK